MTSRITICTFWLASRKRLLLDQVAYPTYIVLVEAVSGFGRSAICFIISWTTAKIKSCCIALSLTIGAWMSTVCAIFKTMARISWYGLRSVAVKLDHGGTKGWNTWTTHKNTAQVAGHHLQEGFRLVVMVLALVQQEEPVGGALKHLAQVQYGVKQPGKQVLSQLPSEWG